jgi:hypothetical protein
LQEAHSAADVTGLLSRLQHLRHLDEQQLDNLRQRVGQLESERDSAHRYVKQLQDSLADAVSRQEHTEIHVNNLETLLREQEQRHQSALDEALIRERRQARRLSLAMLVAIAAFLLGIAVNVTTYLEAENNARLLTGINQGIQDMQASLERHKASAPTGPEMAASRETSPVATPDQIVAAGAEPPSIQAVTKQIPATPVLPEPDFVTSGTLPLDGHTFGSRQGVRAFFEENARQPGVTTLPSGLQYRILIPGSGRTPLPSDTVVIEYRAFRPDGTELDNSFRETQPSTFVVSEATPGLREALQHMQENAQWELYIPPALVSKGVRKRGGFGFEPLIYTLELLSVVRPQTPD